MEYPGSSTLTFAVEVLAEGCNAGMVEVIGSSVYRKCQVVPMSICHEQGCITLSQAVYVHACVCVWVCVCVVVCV